MNLSPTRLTAAMSTAMQLLAELPDDDELLQRDTVDGQTEALDLMDQIAEQVMADEALAEQAKARAKRLEARADKRRAIILNMLEALDLREPLQRPLYTASLSYRTKAQVTDPDALPEAFIRRAPDMVAIGKALRADVAVPGATLGNPAPVLTIRSA